MNDLVEFIKVADVGLAEEVEEGDYDGLVAVMGHLMAVKDRQATTDEMFEPLKQTIELLKTYGQELPEEVHTQLQVKMVSCWFVLLYGMVWYGMVWYGMVWYGMVWYGMVWYGMVWYGMVWYGMVCVV